MLKSPFYDPTKSYQENYDSGPYGAFSKNKTFTQNGDPSYIFFGQKIFLPFGIPAGPIINSKFAKGAFNNGFDIVVYKTVRSDYYPCHQFPNVLAVNIQDDLTIEKARNPLVAGTNYSEPLSITNSFGVPSVNPEVWQEDVSRAVSYAGKGQVLVLSFMGTLKENQTKEEFIEDYALTAKLAMETGAKILEMNLSCPNIGNEGLVCYNLDTTKKVCIAVRNVIGNTPLILKVGYYENLEQLEQLARIAHNYADGVAAINTIQAEIVDEDGKQALPGEMRKRSGVCGTSIKWAGLEMVKKLKKITDENNYKFSIIGVGGVTQPEDYFEYLHSGAESVMSATGAMWNPHLAQEIKIREEKAIELITNWHTTQKAEV